MKLITPCLWFDGNAEEAAKFYTSIFPNSKIKNIIYNGKETAESSGGAIGSVLMVTFELDGQEFHALNGGPGYPFSQAVSFVVNCKDQKELDSYWKKLTAGGKEVACSWLTDKFGLSWQIVPAHLGELLDGKDQKKVDRVMHEVIGMVKLDIKKLEEAAYVAK